MRVGVIGAGRVSGGHAAAVKSVPKLRLHAVSEPDEERRGAFAQRHGCAAYADRREMLSDGEIDLALLGLPHWLHAPIAIDCLNASVHTLVEKPMAVSLEECNAMTAAADANGVQLMVRHMQQFFQANLVTRRLLRDGRIGDIVIADECWHKSYGLAGAARMVQRPRQRRRDVVHERVAHGGSSSFSFRKPSRFGEGHDLP